MVDREKISKLFKRFAGETIDLNGLKCIPVGVGEEIISKRYNKPYYPIEFKIENPNDVSYFYSIVEDDLLDIVMEFEEYVNLKLTTKILWGENPKFYLNEKTKNEIQKVFDSVREIKFTTGTPFIGYKRWEIQIESIGLKTNNFDDDAYYINNAAVPISATKNDEPTDVNDAIIEYIDGYLINKETYYESEEYYKGVDQVITQYPLLNADYIATYYDTKFIQ
jgi:hypothetical protein